MRDRFRITKLQEDNIEFDLCQANAQCARLLDWRSLLEEDKASISLSTDMLDSTTAFENYFKALTDSANISRAILCKSSLTLVKESVCSTGCCSDESTQILEVLISSNYTPSECRAEALYILGMDYLEKGRQHGDLQVLWRGHSSTRYESHGDAMRSEGRSPLLNRAKDLLFQAASFAGPASSLLARNILRTLALVLGPEETCSNDSISAGELVHTSIGSSARQTVSRNSTTIMDKTHCDRSIFHAYDCPISNSSTRQELVSDMHHQGANIIPSTWGFIAMTVCPTGELLVSALKKSEIEDDKTFYYTTACVFPDVQRSQHETNRFVETIIHPFQCIMERSKRQLSGINETVANAKFNSFKERKKAWWDERYKIDDALQDLLEQIDTQLFRPNCVQNLLSQATGHTVSDTGNMDEHALDGCNLSARFEAACTMNDTNLEARDGYVPSKDELQKLTVVKLKDRLKELDVNAKTIRSLRKAGLIDLLHAELSRANIQKSPPVTDTTDSTGFIAPNACTFLILDENLCRLPLEGVETLREKSVCRTPSLPFIIESLRRMNLNQSDKVTTSIDQSRIKYVIDPESNLPETQKSISSIITSISDDKELNWEGVIGELPTKEFMENNLKEKHSLYLYFGHGAGEKFFSRADIDNLLGSTSKDTDFDDTQQCNASMILMGCSSGDLVSVNDDRGNIVMDNPMHFEPEGAALSYICAGAPCVVANLWDVTDRDIDRFSISLLERFFRSNQSNIANCVATSRNACKLKYIVGAAPVVYGVPIAINNF